MFSGFTVCICLYIYEPQLSCRQSFILIQIDKTWDYGIIVTK